MNKSTFVLLVILISTATAALAQKGDGYEVEKGKSNFMSRVYKGGGFSLGGGSQAIAINFSPMVGYMITSKLSAGLGASYQYYKIRNTDFQDNRYGGKVFLRQNIVNPVFIYSEYNFLNYGDLVVTSVRNVATRFLVGGGISQPLGGMASINFIGSYDLIYDAFSSPFDSPWVFSVFFSI